MWLVVAVLRYPAPAARRPRRAHSWPSAILVLGVVLHVVYHTVLVGGCGQTLGKMVLGIAVVRRDGAPAGYGRALLRCAGGGLCLLTLGLGRLGRARSRATGARLSDLLAGTRPVSRPSPLRGRVAV